MPELQDPDIFYTILDSLPTGVCLLGRDGRIHFWNQGAEAITGYLRHEVGGRFSRESILGQCNDQGCILCGASCPFAASMQDGKPREARIQLHHKQGHQVPVRMQIAPIRDRHGSLLGIAENFDAQKLALDRDRRQDNLAAYGCVDEITEIPNHSFTQFHLQENLASFSQYQLPFGIMLIQVDRLEQFRASYGRRAGDAILRVVAQTMRNTLRPSDFLGRWEENQFLAILMNCAGQQVENVGQRTRKVVSCAKLHWWGDQLPVTTSVGYATAQPDDTAEVLLERARQSVSQLSGLPTLADQDPSGLAAAAGTWSGR
jgi:diguanylate cyclase (GGDEF)-like protein/PAS domain S-box-containing protein